MKAAEEFWLLHEIRNGRRELLQAMDSSAHVKSLSGKLVFDN
jgi:hypothetical protein